MDSMIDRRLMLASLGAAAAFGFPTALGAQAPAGGFVMWRDPGCGCCVEWAKRVEAAFKRKMPVVQVADMARIKAAQGVPDGLHSCHTALIQGYVVEGHVPPADIQRLVRSKSRTLKGLAVPGMPAGSPGMDVGHDRKEPYQVFAFDAQGRRSVFANHG